MLYNNVKIHNITELLYLKMVEMVNLMLLNDCIASDIHTIHPHILFNRVLTLGFSF